MNAPLNTLSCEELRLSLGGKRLIIVGMSSLVRPKNSPEQCGPNRSPLRLPQVGLTGLMS